MTTELKDYEAMISYIEATRNEVLEFFKNEDTFTKNNMLTHLIVDLHKETTHPLICLSRQTGLTSITALRNFHDSLLQAKKKLENQPDHYKSSIKSLEAYIKMCIDGFDELQRVTGDKTPISLNEGRTL